MRQQKLQTINRRTFLSGGRESGGETPALRPPWTDERTVVSQCSACGDCVRACPESILIAGDGGLPEISFQYGACTFCGDCAAACEEQVFDAGRDRPWSLKVSITGACLLKSGVTCQSCTDVCDADALRFNLRIRPSGAIEADLDACTGCGACVAPCPAAAIVIHEQASGAMS